MGATKRLLGEIQPDGLITQGLKPRNNPSASAPGLKYWAILYAMGDERL